MRPDLWTRADQLVDEALALPTRQRAGFVEQACQDDMALRDEVLELLAADRAAGSFLAGAALGPLEVADEEDESGGCFGPYRLLRLLGRGGMGSVYLAEREDGHYRQQVAIKVIRGPWSGLGGRLRTERQALARLEHPNIARLYDGGATDDGRPYLVMEYVDGRPLDAWCDQQYLPIDARLRLFLRVCAAVHHAHRNLLVHRDLKPANILVTAEGTPKLLDFGIAKPLDRERFDATAQTTRTGVRPMTPSYASPEQVRGEAITTATDVYSLGVLLYRLLTGRGPYLPRRDLPHEIERLICEQDCERPSNAVVRAASAGAPDADAVGRAFGLRPHELCRRLRGDLDTIVQKAMRKEPERRYASAQQLAEDIDRHLNDRPVLARPDSWPYRLGKFARRNALGVAAGVGATVLLIAFSVLAGLQALRSDRERQIAEAERSKAQQVSGFLMGLFEQSRPDSTNPSELTVREVLDRGAKKLDELEDQPELQAAYMDTVGSVYRSLGLYADAAPYLEGALHSRRQLHGPTHPEIAGSLGDLAYLRLLQADYATAEKLYQEALAMYRSSFDDRNEDVAIALGNLAVVARARGDFEAAEPLYRQALAQKRQLFGDEHPEVATAMSNLALLLKDRGDLVAAEPLYRQALAIRRQALGDEHLGVAVVLNNLAALLRTQGDLEAAGPLYSEALRIHRKLLGDRHPELATMINNVAMLLHDRGDFEAAEPLYRESLAMRRSLLGEEHPLVASSLNNLAALLEDREAYADAASLYREALAIRRRNSGDDHPKVGMVLNNLAGVLLRQGDPAAAESMYREAAALVRRLLGEEHPNLALVSTNLARSHLAQGEAAAAEVLLLGALDTFRRKLPAGHWRTAYAESVLGACLDALGRHTEAEALLLASYPLLREQIGEQAPKTRDTLRWIVEHYEALGMAEEAARYRATADTGKGGDRPRP